MDILPTTGHDEVVEHVRSLQMDRMDDEAETLDDLKIAASEEPSAVLRNIFDRLKSLRRENQALDEIRAILGVDSTSDLPAEVEDLKTRVGDLREQQQSLEEAGFERAEVALEALTSMEEQLNELYGEKEVAEKNDLATLVEEEGDTFDQLQALLAREEKLQRELGVTDPDEVIEMVESLSAQLEDVYQERDSTRSTDTIFEPRSDDVDGSGIDASSVLEKELGVSDPDAVTTMVDDLTNQLETLYDERERLAEYDLGGPEEAIRMVKNMQQQLETLYAGQEEMSEHGIDGIEYALSVIENMESQLGELYEDRRRSEESADEPSLEEATERLKGLEKKVSELTEEKEHLREKRDRLEGQFEQIEDRLGTGDPDAISAMIDSLTAQLEEVYRTREQSASRSASDDSSVLDEDSKDHLANMNLGGLNSKSIGVFGLDDQGTVQKTNELALGWPDLAAEASETLVGRHFFESVAPGSNSALFHGRFSRCVERGEMDEQFSYAYVDSEGHATNLSIHVFSVPSQQLHWIAFRVLERH